MAKKKGFDLERLVRIPNVWGYDVAPDGKTAAIVWDKSGRLEIYLLSLTGAGRPRRITSGPGGKVAPRFAPEGKRLVFAQDYGGDENYDLFVYDIKTRATRNLTPDTPAETINPRAAWSPDGRWLAFTSNRGGQFATYIMPADSGLGGGPPRRITQHEYSDMTVEWSPSGEHLAITALTQGQETWIFLAPVADGAAGGAAWVVGGPGGPVDATQPRWAPDGRRLACSGNAGGMTVIYIYSLSPAGLVQVTPGTHEAAEPAWAPDGERLAYTWNVDGNSDLGLLHLPSGEVRHWRAAPGVHSEPRFSADGGTLLSLFDGPRHPASLWAMAVGAGLPRRPPARLLAGGLPPGYTGREFVQPEVLRWENEGLTIAGLLYKPRGFRRDGRAPAVLWVHGGPTWEFKNEWWVTVQHLVSEGCLVLAPNYRGSTGRGRAFQDANRFDLGGADMRDVIAGAAFLAREGYADPRRLAITGGSYGGYLTMTALTRHPRVFAAGSALVPFLNWFTEHASEREDLQYWDKQNFGDPLLDADRYRAYSPIFYMENISAPVQMLAGANDPRCPAAETEQAAQALKELNVPHEIVIYPDEGHGFQKVENRVDASRRRAAFLREHLGLRGAAGR